MKTTCDLMELGLLLTAVAVVVYVAAVAFEPWLKLLLG